MLLLSCSNLARGFDEGPLFEHVGFELRSGDRVGLVGLNGVGKTTLLRILAGQDQPDEGDVRRHAGARVAILEQQPVFQPGLTLFDEASRALAELVAAHDDLVRTADALARSNDEAEHRSLAARYDRLNELLRYHDAYNVDHRVERVLDGLGFQALDFDRPVDTFSGGQQGRLMLAKLLLAAPDVMFLDEPSNHLDIRGTEWLEEYLREQHEAMLIVSHDRFFLDKVVTKIWELHAARLTEYPGNYSAYTRLRQERFEHQLREWESQHEYIAKQEDYIRRVHYGQLHKQAQSRQKALDKLERVERPIRIETPQMHFREVQRSGDVVLEVEDLTKSYDRPLFTGLSFSLPRGGRLGILGPNGSGKTTLLRILLGRESADSGTVKQGQLVRFGYFDQHLKLLADDLPVIRAVWPENDPEATEQRLRDLLGRFGLTGDQVYQQVGELSGGEQSRAALARLVASQANVLVLDEPTNHLDLWACDSLEQALQEFEGTAIIVSHDRYLLNRVADQLIVLEGDGRCQVIHGNYDTYELMNARQGKIGSAEKRGSATAAQATPANQLEANSLVKRKRKRQFPYRKVADLEADIATQEAHLRDLEQLLGDPDLYRDGERVKATLRDFDETKARLQQLYEHWEEAVELN
jgi:ATP-binding cassette, subfamily F, member 3